jgi:hypothetical protein
MNNLFIVLLSIRPTETYYGCYKTEFCHHFRGLPNLFCHWLMVYSDLFWNPVSVFFQIFSLLCKLLLMEVIVVI